MVDTHQRFTRSNPCPICGGGDDEPRGQGRRCFGFLSSDGSWAHCSREELAASLPLHEKSRTYAHHLHGECRCGVVHGEYQTKPVGKTPGRRQRRIDAAFDYTDEHGNLLYQVVRYEPKGFGIRRPRGDGKWIWNVNGTRRVLYRLQDLTETSTDDWVWVPEGEKHVDRLRELGLVATCNPMGAGKWLDEYSEQLRGRHVLLLPDNDEPGRAHVEKVARSLYGKVAGLRVVGLPRLPDRGDVLDWLDAGHTVEELHGRALEAPDWAPTSLDDVLVKFRRWLKLRDLDPVLALLGTIAANRLPGDPVWILFVGSPGVGKTELLNSPLSLPDVHEAATLTPAALLSGTPQKEKTKDATGGLLREIGVRGVILCKDFGSVLSMRQETRAEVLAALREIYDGRWTRRLGTEGGRSYQWHGHAGFMGGVTATIDRHHGVMAALGERFLLLRLGREDMKELALNALETAGREDEMRRDLADAVASLFAELPGDVEVPEVTEDERSRLVALSTLITQCRSAVDRDGYGREIVLVHPPEAPTRFAKTLLGLLRGLLVLGLARDRAWAVVTRVGLDSMPTLRRIVLAELQAKLREHEWDSTRTTRLSTAEIATAIGYPTSTTRRVLEDLAAQNIVTRSKLKKGEDGEDEDMDHRADVWQLTGRSEEWKEMWQQIDLSR